MYSDLTPWYFCLCSAWVERKGLSPWDDGLLVTHIKSKLFETPDMYFFTLFFSTLHCDYLGEKGAHFPLSFVARFFSLSRLFFRLTGTLLNHCCTTADEQMENLPITSKQPYYTFTIVSIFRFPIHPSWASIIHIVYASIGNQLLHMHQKVDQVWKLIKGTLSLTLQYSNIM